MSPSEAKLVLVLTATGGAELVEQFDETGEQEEILWSSADDDNFRDEFGDELLDEDNVAEIFDYLEENELIENRDAVEVEIDEDDGPGDDDDEDEDDDEYIEGEAI